ncbi:MAG: bacterioferritin [Zymomonas mobilis subsp. pomaceae]|uniref:Bacterioferritin n=1 Tax=Zymomonas mobilis subsp. pomaceae (strain ATCC 29192 / DSM 22645 / JCM 10191 / CCUG 17912 / NBRC 13757 / NCIMB 11200 / NRRL B-4491 / Barker I) TaxID=579138 RepID=F8EW01_ZYMMT|nr:bacterioferritin [Zymomonas mobilis]AEI38411.1 bacterioferritin [Zymomonas mobilis subsp. pomaceae ATCC 29192]MDX5948101.1 bacterioferritin [Zymomonas mobilis subsp. pomaceae]GEB90037.1 bacterioferritin [Zymomonas mobilis subsp. pomaceae]
MATDPKIIDYLNRQLTNELTVINQYFLHARTLEHWGVSVLARKEAEESVEERTHADWLIERIFYLEGIPNLQRYDTIFVSDTVEAVLQNDLKMEEKAVSDLREAISYAETIQDFVSRDLFLKILVSEENHIDFLKTQLNLIKLMGLDRYIQLNSDPA